VQLLRPDFSNLLSKQQEGEIFTLIGKLIQTLSSPEIAIDDRHTPRLYARFLAGLLTKHRRDGATVGRQHPPPPPQNRLSGSSQAENSSLNPSKPAGSRSQSQGPGSSSQSQQQPAREGGYTQVLPVYSEPDAPQVYQQHAEVSQAYSSPNTCPMELYTSDDLGLFNNISEEDMLATMRALENPAWWQNMMMPGCVRSVYLCLAVSLIWATNLPDLYRFVWPDPQSSMKHIDGYNRPGFYNPNANVMGMHNAFGGFLAPEVALR
jgi:hypothetical protein